MSIRIIPSHDKWDEKVVFLDGNIRMTKTNIGEVIAVEKVVDTKVYISFEKGECRIMACVETNKDLKEIEDKVARVLEKFSAPKTIVSIFNNVKYPSKMIKTIEMSLPKVLPGKLIFNQYLVVPGKRLELR